MNLLLMIPAFFVGAIAGGFFGGVIPATVVGIIIDDHDGDWVNAWVRVATALGGIIGALVVLALVLHG